MWLLNLKLLTRHQYLNCKILHGGRFCGNYVILSPQLKCFFPETRRRPKKKKDLRRKLKCFFPEVNWRPKKGLHRNLGLYSSGICKIYSCWLALDRFIIQRSNLDGWTSKSRWGDAKSRWGDANSRWEDASTARNPHRKAGNEEREKQIENTCWNCIILFEVYCLVNYL